GVIHLSGSGTAVPLQGEEIASQQAADEQADGEQADDQQPDQGTDAAAGSATAPEATGEAGEDPPSSPQSGEDAGEVVVHVAGAVKSPGVVRLPPGSRVEDALQAAGGTTEEAELAAINLARPLADGEQIHVPVPGEQTPTVPAPGGAEAGGGPDGVPGEGADGGTIDLNTASAAQLEELPGVGPSIAQRILEHREKNGPFASVDGLLEVSGIGPATLEEIRERARV
ncbi:MAG: helix-hairpin-helix domain-containing protein, partial [Brachybacterium tyrofermentans]